jgi:hypothetical protein
MLRHWYCITYSSNILGDTMKCGWWRLQSSWVCHFYRQLQTFWRSQLPPFSRECKNSKLHGKNGCSARGRSRLGDSYIEPVGEVLWSSQSHG